MAEPFGAKVDGNGSLIRLSTAFCFASYSIDAAMRLAADKSRTTRASPIAEECCRITAALIFKLLNGAAYKAAKADSLDLGWSDALTAAVAAPLAGVDETLIPSVGYVLDSLGASLRYIENTIGF